MLVPPSPPYGPNVELYGLDIETDTTIDGLDPAMASVVAVALSSRSTDVVFMGDESELLRSLDQHLSTLEPGVLVTWNGAGFDLPFLADRAVRCETALGLRIWPREPGSSDAGDQVWPPPRGGFGGLWGSHRHLDGYRVFRADVRRTLPVSCGLKSIARLVGLDTVEVDYDHIHDLHPDDLAEYVASDARLARLLVERRLPGVLSATDREPSGAPAPGARTPPGALHGA